MGNTLPSCPESSHPLTYIGFPPAHVSKNEYLSNCSAEARLTVLSCCNPSGAGTMKPMSAWKAASGLGGSRLSTRTSFGVSLGQLGKKCPARVAFGLHQALRKKVTNTNSTQPFEKHGSELGAARKARHRGYGNRTPIEPHVKPIWQPQCTGSWMMFVALKGCSCQCNMPRFSARSKAAKLPHCPAPSRRQSVPRSSKAAAPRPVTTYPGACAGPPESASRSPRAPPANVGSRSAHMGKLDEDRRSISEHDTNTPKRELRRWNLGKAQQLHACGAQARNLQQLQPPLGRAMLSRLPLPGQLQGLAHEARLGARRLPKTHGAFSD